MMNQGLSSLTFVALRQLERRLSPGNLYLALLPKSWGLPVLSRGLLYVAQNTRDLLQRIGPRLLCYDLRA